MNRLDRFLAAQTTTYETVLGELRAGRKRSHWIWWIFPQLRDLGRSATAQEYGIADLGEAREYAMHPVLGARLLECVGLVVDSGKAPAEVLGEIDGMKFRSCVTLFAAASPSPAPFTAAIERCFDGEPDPLTLEILGPGRRR